MLIPEKLFGIIGDPLQQSLSPNLHNWAFQEQGLAAVYLSWPLKNENMATFIQAMRILPISGCSVTIPHKETVMPALDGVTERARIIGAVNTLYWDKDRLFGDNTDCLGFVAPLRHLGLKPGSALVLGTGGAALACITGLQALGITDISIAGRNPARLQLFQRRFTVTPIPWQERESVKADLLVNSTPLGTRGGKAEQSPYPTGLDAFRIVYDLVYNPLWTRLLLDARKAGCSCISGLEMFVEQAAAQFLLWTQQTFPKDRALQRLREHLRS